VRTFENKVAAITGAGSGIGRALACELAKNGVALALADKNEQAVTETAELARALGVRVTVATLDVADREAVYRWADAVVAEHGRCNLVFNNAGVAVASTLEGVSYEDFEWIMNINFWGVVYGTKAFLPHLHASGDGHVVNISSIFGLVAAPGNGTYNATKFAVRGFTEALRQELEISGAKVSATCVHPGGIKTNIARASRVSHNMQGVLMKDVRTVSSDFDRVARTTAESAARQILNGVKHDKRRVLVGADAKLIDALVRIFPTAYQKLNIALVRRSTR